MEFENEEEEKVREIKKSVETVLGKDVELEIKRKSFSKEDFNQTFFCKIIDNIEFLYKRSNAVVNQVKIDLIDYEEDFYETIEMLLEMNFNKEEMAVINYYIYGSEDEDGEPITLIDENGDPLIMENSEDLWNIISEMKQK